MSPLVGANYTVRSGDGINKLLKKGLRNILKKSAEFVADKSCGGYLYLALNDRFDLNQEPQLFDDFEFHWTILDKPEISINDRTYALHPSRYIYIPNFKTSELWLEIRFACYLVNETLQALRKKGMDGNMLVFKDETRTATQSPWGVQGESEKKEREDLVKELEKAKVFPLAGGQSLSTLDMKPDVLLALWNVSIKYLAFITGFSTVRLKFELATEDAVDINDDLYQSVHLSCQLFNGRIIDQLLEKLNLQADYEIAPIRSINEQEQAEIQKKQADMLKVKAETLKAYLELLTPTLKEFNPKLYTNIENYIHEKYLNKNGEVTHEN